MTSAPVDHVEAERIAERSVKGYGEFSLLALAYKHARANMLPAGCVAVCSQWLDTVHSDNPINCTWSAETCGRTNCPLRESKP